MTSRTPAQIVSDQLAKLAITIPGMSFEIGTPERKILDTFAESIAEVQIDNYIVSTQLDIDTKSGTDLDDFVGMFGFGRLQGNYSTGIITFYVTTPATQTIYLPAGIQASTASGFGSAPLIFSTSVPGNINIGQLSVSIAAHSTVIGSIGNVSAGTVSVFSTGAGITTVNNLIAFSNGTDNETDEALRSRFKKTFLRNIAGTEDFYISIALQGSGVSRVKVLGPVSSYQSQAQTTTQGTSVNLATRNCKFLWPQGFAVASNKDSGDPSNPEIWYTQDVDYSVGYTTDLLGNVTPNITPISPSTQNKFLDISYEYCSLNSRNDPLNLKTNKVDVFVDGVNALQVTEQIVTKAIQLSSFSTNQYYFSNYQTVPSGVIGPSTKFQRLGSTPIVTYPTSFIAGGNTYTLGVNYIGILDISNNRGSEREASGIAWITTPPADGLTSTVVYTYNQTPQVLNSLFKRSKQITTDVLVRSAVTKYLSFYFIIMYNSGVSISTVNSNIQNSIKSFIASLGFGAWLQLSDLATIIHNISGVDNCRYAKISDGAPYTVSEMSNGISNGIYYTSDFQIADNTVPALDSLYLIRRSFNTFGS